MISTTLALIIAIASPFVFGFMNILDKYVVSYKVRGAMSFAALAGMVNLAFGIIFALFLGWSGVSFNEVIFPAIAGVLSGLQFYFYYIIMGKEDASHMVGLIYTYPLIVAILSFLFLNENISLIGYIGMGFVLLGVLMLSVRINKIKLKASIWMIVFMIIIVAFYEFFVKVATINLPETNGIAINMIFIGLSVLPMFLSRNVRKGFKYELKNTKWALLNESFTFLGVMTLYFAMSGLPATIVSSIAAIQPLAVLFYERIMQKRFGKMSRDTELLPKLIPILLIVIGVVLLYLPEVIKL